MGCDIHLMTEIKKDNKWELNEELLFIDDYSKSDSPFDRRSYRIFAFLADVRQRDNFKITPISEPKGLPKDSEYLNTPLEKPENYSYYGYDNGTAYTKEGQIECDVDCHSLTYLTLKELLDFDYEQKATETETYREYLMEGYFEELEILKTLGEPENVRIVFWFDN